MGFRFRRTIKLFPGVRVNIGLRGISTSVGVPGARLTLSRRGRRATFGIPGTGFSFSQSLTGSTRSTGASSRPEQRRPINTLQELEAALSAPNSAIVYRGSGRRLSPQQMEATRRRFIEQQRRELARAEVTASEAQQRDLLNCWRDSAEIPSDDAFRESCEALPFEYDESPPTPPHEEIEQTRLQNELRARVRAEHPIPFSHRIGVGAVSVVGAAAAALPTYVFAEHNTLAAAVGIVAGLTGGLAAWIFLSRRWKARQERLLRDAFNNSWPVRQRELSEQHAHAIEQYEDRRRRAEAEWIACEEERAAWARRLVSGDVEAVNDAVLASLSDIDFPFDAHCDVAMSDATEAFLHLDLPEIEDIIPETRSQVLKDGRVRQVKRTSGERNRDYAFLVAGLALELAQEAFATAPTLKILHIAAYTQRGKRGTDGVLECYVYDAKIAREQVTGLDLASVDPLAFLAIIGAQFEQKANGQLKALKPPTWTGELPP